MENGELFPTTEGTPQGGIVSPLLANIALDGMERVIREAFPRKRNCPRVVRYADDLVILDEKREVVEKCQEIITEWLKGMGLELKPSKTRITHTLLSDGEAGFNFLGFNIRQYRVSKGESGINPGNKERLGFKTIIKPSKESVKRHSLQLSEVIDQHKSAKQVDLIKKLGPIIKGWTNYFSTVCSKETYHKMDGKLLSKLRAWIGYRHPTKSRTWANRKYWKREGNSVYFSPKQSNMRLGYHSDTLIKRHVKIEGKRSPYDGDWIYWSSRMGRHPGVSNRIARLLKKQIGKCQRCGLYFRDGDLLEVDHIIPKQEGGKDAYYNWQLLHRHCHDEKTMEDCRRCA
jgi:RNA-directed DNA polymerase